MHSVVVISVNSTTALAAVRKLFWDMLRRGDVGLRGIGISGSGYIKVLALDVLNAVDCVKRKRHAEFPASHQLLAQSLQLFRSRRACVCAYVHVVCVCVCACMCIDVHVHMYMYVHVYMYLYACIYMCICVCIHIYA